MAENLLVKLEDILDEFQKYLTDKGPDIIKVIKAIRALIPDLIDPLIDSLIELLKDLRVQVDKLKEFDEINDAVIFAGKVKTLVDVSKVFFTEPSKELEEVSNAVDVLASLPSITDVKAIILQHIDAIILELGELKKP